MSFLDGILGQIVGSGEGNAVIENLGAKVGISPDLVHQAVSALAQAHTEPGDTVQGAANATGLPQDTLQQILEHLGGEGALASIAATLL